MSHYDTLRVDKGATPDEITKAYRKLAMRFHPDRNLNKPRDEQLAAEVAFKALQEAYEVLSDPARRAHYDETGSNDLPESIDEEARGVLMQFIDAALSNPRSHDLLADIRTMLEMFKSPGKSNAALARAKLKRLRRQRKRIQGPEKGNLIHLVIERKINAVEADLEAAERNLEVAAAAERELAKYAEMDLHEQDEDPAARIGFEARARHFLKGE